jgi:histidyl-tRNA synthetase
MGLSYRINPRLVRGLDYYCHTAFEFVTDHLGAQNAVLAGGRYDGLIEMMGGKPTPAVGFAGGVERLIALCEQTPDTPSHSTLIPIGPEAEAMLPELSYALRAAGKAVNFAYQGNLRKRMKKAHQSGASFAIIFGEDEIKAGRFILKDFTTSNERSVTKEELFSCL